MSFGSGGPPGRPYGVPPLFVWRDVASGAEVVVTSESGYGGPGTQFVLPNGVALAVDWTGDNSGPSANGARSGLAGLRAQFPGANVHASTFNAFFQEANKPENKAKLPIVTAEVGDAWIYGVPSDPLKCARFRAAARLRDQCLASGECARSSAAMKTFDRMLVKVPEHTWGLAQSWFLPDYTNWSNVDFNRARAAVKAPVLDNRQQADYFTQEQSWHEQRAFITNAVDAVRGSIPAFASRLDAEFKALSDVRVPSTEGYVRAQPNAPLNCGCAAIVEFDTSGAISLLQRGNVSWANASHRLGRYIYQSFDDTDYQEFLAGNRDDYSGPGFGRPSCTPNNTQAICGNFNKPRMALGGAKHRELSPTLKGLWQKGCDFLVEATLPDEAHTLAGAPATVWTVVTMDFAAGDELKLDFEFRQIAKTATRLPEALFVQFRPAVPSDGWGLEMFNTSEIVLDPTDVMPSPGGSGGAPHTRCVSGVRWDGLAGGLHLSSADVPCIASGKPTPFPTPRNVAPDMSYGVSYNVYNNIWNTNYVLWYPFDEADEDLKSRFTLLLRSPQDDADRAC